MSGLFPDHFVWGAASSAYQIEGASAEGGRGPSVWDAFCAQEGKVFRGHSGAVACDHYHHFEEDVRLMKSLGLKAYRFSVSWPRVLPEGAGRPNVAGLSFYDRLVDALLEAGIRPWVTLFHWDFPQALLAKGGWLDAKSPGWFADYASAVVDRLGDRVQDWMTINEPQIFLGMGHRDGTHAPGLKLPTADWLRAGHHALLAHGRGVQVIRSRAKLKPSVGWAPCGRVEYPASDKPADIEAARKSTFSVTAKDCWNNSWWSDPVCLGQYPEDGLKLFASDAPKVGLGDMALIKQPLDFYGVNIYTGEPVEADGNGAAKPVGWPAGNPMTTFRWNVAPKSLYWGPRFLSERYRLPVVITENGMANLDWVTPDKKVHDPQRIEYTRAYLLELGRAAADGVDVRGYFHWSIMDNFEWAEGYRERFGLVHVDYQTLERTPKDSAHWYRAVIESNGRSLEGTVATPAAKKPEVTRGRGARM